MQYAAAALRLAVLLMLPAALCGCDWFDGEELPFAWAEPGYRASYTFTPTVDSFYSAPEQRWVLTPAATQHALELYVTKFDVPGSRIIERSYELPYYSISRFLGGDLVNVIFRKEDGLHTITDCSDGSETALRVPARPRLGRWLRDCPVTGTPMMRPVVLDTLIEVPAGRFSVFVLENLGGTFREYWNEQLGLVRFEHEVGYSELTTVTYAEAP